MRGNSSYRTLVPALFAACCSFCARCSKRDDYRTHALPVHRKDRCSTEPATSNT